MSTPQETAVLAQCVYELRLLLAYELGSTSTAERPVRVAAHLAYALHNQALAALAGRPFDVERAIDQVGSSVRVVDPSTSEYLRSQLLAAVRDAAAQQKRQDGLPGSSSQ